MISSPQQKFKENLKALVAEYPDGLSSYKIMRLYKEKFDHEFTFLDHECTSINEFCVRLPDGIFRIE